VSTLCDAHGIGDLGGPGGDASSRQRASSRRLHDRTALRATDPDGDDGVRNDTRDVDKSYVDANIQPDITSLDSHLIAIVDYPGAEDDQAKAGLFAWRGSAVTTCARTKVGPNRACILILSSPQRVRKNFKNDRYRASTVNDHEAPTGQ
jgi:hypothetical protein